MKEKNADGRARITLPDPLPPARDSALDLFEGERGFYLLASLAMGEIFKKAHLRRAGLAEIFTEWFAEDASSH